jgi:hypothetical protein
MSGACNTNGGEEERMSFVGKSDGKRPLGRPRQRWVNNIKIDLLEIGCDGWTGLVWIGIGTSGELL